MQSDFFYKVVEVVSSVTEVPECDILSCCRKVEVVDARSIVIYILYSRKYYVSSIARLLGMTRAGVRYALSMFDTRLTNNIFLGRYISEVVISPPQTKSIFRNFCFEFS